MKASFWASVLSASLLVGACTTPQVTPISDDEIFDSELLSFLNTGSTLRSQTLLKLGNPSGRFENDRILTYQIRVDSDGQPQIYWPRTSSVSDTLTYWDPGLFSLVLVFDDAGVLDDLSLVGAN